MEAGRDPCRPDQGSLAQEWGFGLDTPLECFTFADLKLDAEYEVQVEARTAAGEGEPEFLTMRTNATVEPDNVLPFPRL